jgi:hypothetical protein
MKLFKKFGDKGGKISSEWENALMTNFYKKGSSDECRNYRGIALLVTPSRLYANMLKIG